MDEYKNEMHQVNASYYQLQAKGVVFPVDVKGQAQEAAAKQAQNNPDAVSNQQEADDIAKAIAESLKTE